jgi:hypothetical protein
LFTVEWGGGGRLGQICVQDGAIHIRRVLYWAGILEVTDARFF